MYKNSDMNKSGKIQFRQYLYHDIENGEETEKYLETVLPLIGYIVMYFNSLEQSLNLVICEYFTDRTDRPGLLPRKLIYWEVNTVKKLISTKDDFNIRAAWHHCNYSDNLFCLKEPGVSQIFVRRILRQWRSPVLSLSCQRFGTYFGNYLCSDTRNERYPMHSAFHFQYTMCIFWFYKKAQNRDKYEMINYFMN